MIRQCQVIDLSRTGVRLTVNNADSLSNRFTLILSKNSSGRPARVKWRRGSEVGAEFFEANSSLGSRLTADAPGAVKPGGGEGQKSNSLMSTLSIHGQAQPPDVVKPKIAAREVVGGISGDKAETEVYSRIADRGGPIVQAAQEKKKTEALIQSINELEKILCPENPGLFNDLYAADPKSNDVQDILAIFATLNQSCPE